MSFVNTCAALASAGVALCCIDHLLATLWAVDLICPDPLHLRVGLIQGCPLPVALYNLAILPSIGMSVA
eukprot:6209963-Amphidinium_carterae.4